MKLAVFDLDGTLIDSNEDIAIVTNMLREELGFKKKSIEEIRKNIGDGAGKLIERSIPEVKYNEELKKHFKELYLNNAVMKTVLYDNVKETLFELRDRGYLFALLTNKPEMIAKKIINHFGLSYLFKIVIGEDTLDVRKPDSKTLNLIIDELDANKENTVMIGDGVNDILVAKNTGVSSILCNYGYGESDKINKELSPDFTIDKFKELLNVLK